MSNQRQFFRLEYPPVERPKLEVKRKKHHYLVLDVSEEGMRFVYQGEFDLEEGESINGKITFQSGKSCDVEGTILRHYPDKKWCAVKLTKGVPLAIMMEENRLLLAKYKK